MERDFLLWLEERVQANAGVRVGIGDDAAVLDLPESASLVVTTDLLIDEVHFRSAIHSPEQIGRKALGVNLSDLAAMAAQPLGAVVAIAVPRGAESGEIARGVLEGMEPLAQEFGSPIVGGDTNVTRGPLTLSVTCFGLEHPKGSFLRSGARSGDRLLVTGELGGSLLRKHIEFTPRIVEARLLADRYQVNAAMDLSDGLALDLSRMARRSGVGAIVELDKVPIAGDAVEMSRTEPERSPLERALGDGEDFELLLAVPPDVANELLASNPLGCGLWEVGEVTAETTLLGRKPDGQLVPLPNVGYLHQ